MINDSSATDDPTKDTGSTAGMSTWRARLLAEKIEKGQFVDYPEVGRALTFLFSRTASYS